MGKRCVVFDLGGVLVDWDPRNLYRKLLPSDEAVDRFLSDVCDQAWNEKQDVGRSADVAIRELAALHPGKAELISAYYERFDEMIAGLIEENVALADELISRDVRLYALTNWSADTFPVLDRYDLLHRFEGRVLVSGREGLRKSNPAIYQRFTERFHLEPSELLFIDDVAANVRAAQECGWRAEIFARGEPIAEKVLAWCAADR